MHLSSSSSHYWVLGSSAQRVPPRDRRRDQSFFGIRRRQAGFELLGGPAGSHLPRPFAKDFGGGCGSSGCESLDWVAAIRRQRGGRSASVDLWTAHRNPEPPNERILATSCAVAILVAQPAPTSSQSGPISPACLARAAVAKPHSPRAIIKPAPTRGSWSVRADGPPARGSACCNASISYDAQEKGSRRSPGLARVAMAAIEGEETKPA